MKISALVPFALALCAAATVAQEQPLPPAPPPPPPVVAPGVVVPTPNPEPEPLESEIRIYETERGTVQEYRVEGRLYMVRVIPRRGRPYYLIDRDGDGMLETRRSGLQAQPIIPQWVLFRW
jgi:hypothetical protein